MNESNRPDPADNVPPSPSTPEWEQKEAAAQEIRAQAATEKIAKQVAAADLANTPGWERVTLEKLAFASLNEQKATRRWKTFVRLSWLAFFIVLVWMALHRGTPASDTTTPHTAVVEIKGEIAAGADASAEFVNAALKAAFEDDGAKAVVLLINSPGGSPVQAGMMNDEILRLKAKHKKPVYAVVGETCASEIGRAHV